MNSTSLLSNNVFGVDSLSSGVHTCIHTHEHTYILTLARSFAHGEKVLIEPTVSEGKQVRIKPAVSAGRGLQAAM